MLGVHHEKANEKIQSGVLEMSSGRDDYLFSDRGHWTLAFDWVQFEKHI